MACCVAGKVDGVLYDIAPVTGRLPRRKPSTCSRFSGVMIQVKSQLVVQVVLVPSSSLSR